MYQKPFLTPTVLFMDRNAKDTESLTIAMESDFEQVLNYLFTVLHKIRHTEWKLITAQRQSQISDHVMLWDAKQALLDMEKVQF